MSTWRLIIRTIRRFAVVSIVISLAIAAAYRAHGGAYLPGIGPAPLRFLPIVARGNLSILPPLDMGEDKAEPESTETTASTTNATASIETEDSAPGETNTVIATEPSENSEPAGTNPVAIESFAGPSTGYNAVVSPQVLAEYFKPAQGGTNGLSTSVFIPAEVGFMPPSVKHSSQATYKTE